MKKILCLFFLSLTLIILLSFKPALAKDDSPQRRVVIQSDEVIPGPIFQAGDSIYLQGEVDGDVFLFGGEVVVDATVNGDLIVFAGQTDIKGKILDDLRVAAAQTDLEAVVEGNAVLTGGQVSFEPGSTVNRSLVTAAGLIDYRGQVNDTLRFYAGRTRFNGLALKDVFINSGAVDIYSDTVIHGNLKISYGEKPIISNRALVSGDLIEEKTLPVEGRPSFKDLQPKTLPAVKKITAFIIVQKLVSLSVNVLIGWLLLMLLPQLAQKLVNLSHRQPGSAIGWGFLTLFLTPFIGLIFTVSLIGIPLGVLTFLYYVFSLYLSQLIAGLIIGNHLLKDTKFKKSYLSLLLGLLILSLLKLIPFLGWIAYFIFILFGLGVLILHQKSAVSKLKLKLK